MRLSEKHCIQRRQRLLAQVDADLIVISNPRHVLYFSGYWATPLHIGSWGTPHLLIEARSGRTTLFTHNFAPNTDAAFVDDVRQWAWYDATNDPAPSLFPKQVAELSQHLGGYLGAEIGWLPYGITADRVDDITSLILEMRRHKDPDEMAMLKACVAAVEAGHRAAREAIRPGASELDVYNAIYSAIVSAAAEPVLPLGDFASGERAYRIGGPPTSRILQVGDLMIVDLFPVIAGYRADFTATYAASDTLTEGQSRLEEALHAALSAGESQLKAGVQAHEVYEAVRAALDRYGFAGAFPHHAGHGVGLGHPEAPYLVANSDEVLQVGDVVTLEPGAYGPTFGARIEHNYRITAEGFERLTHHNTKFLD